MLLRWIILLLAVSTLAGCALFPGNQGGSMLSSSRSRITAPPANPADMLQVVQANTQFGLDLYQQLRAQSEDNLFFSPYSISLALAMTEAGARGETREEMDRVLGFDLPQGRLHPAMNALDLAVRAAPPTEMDEEEREKAFQLSIANSVWGQEGYPFEQAYLDLLAEQYGAGLRLADYANDPEAAREAINRWVSEETREKIQDLIPERAITTATRLVLANAIYFKAGWRHPFDPESSRPAEFTRADGSTSDVWMMADSGYYSYASGDGWQALALPYVGGKASMVVLLPDSGRLVEFEEQLDADVLGSILGQMEMQDAIVYFPRFRFDSSFELAKTLEQMGMVLAFDPDQADFNGMAATDELYISRVVHKATVDVDEAGTEAAAATAVIAAAGAAPDEQEPVVFRADRPFLFLIREDSTGTILFLGRVMQPEE